MKKIGILSVMAMLLLAVGVSAVSDVWYTVDSPSGHVEITTSYSVGGFDSASSPTTQMTSTDFQHIENTGALLMTQHMVSYGTGLDWPDRNSAAQGYGDTGADYGEWAGKQSTGIETTGETTYGRVYEVWTVHPTWYTNYEFGGMLTSPTTSTFIEGEGIVQGNTFVTTASYDNSGQDPYESYEISSYSFTNPFVGASAFGWVNGFQYN